MLFGFEKNQTQTKVARNQRVSQRTETVDRNTQNDCRKHRGSASGIVNANIEGQNPRQKKPNFGFCKIEIARKISQNAIRSAQKI